MDKITKNYRLTQISKVKNGDYIYIIQLSKFMEV